MKLKTFAIGVGAVYLIGALVPAPKVTAPSNAPAPVMVQPSDCFAAYARGLEMVRDKANTVSRNAIRLNITREFAACSGDKNAAAIRGMNDAKNVTRNSWQPKTIPQWGAR